LKYYSREILEQYLKDTRFNKVLDIIDETEPYLTTGKTVPAQINVRLCRDCPYFEQEHPRINTDGDLGYCTYKTDFVVFDDEPIHWYFTNKNSFCDENTLGDEDAY
jgi:hypothetical protein